MKKVLPTKRLADVLVESIQALEANRAIRTAVAQVLADYETMPQEAVLSSLRLALDKNPILSTSKIIEAVAYLKLNSRKLDHARNRARKMRGITDHNDFTPNFPENDILPLVNPEFSLDDIEAALKNLTIE